VSRERELAILAEREELIREALSRPGGVTRPEPGCYVSYFSRATCLEALDEIADERARLQPRRSRQAPATASRGRCTAAAFRPVPHDHRNRQVRHQPGREHSMLSTAVIGAGVIVVIAVERIPLVARDTLKVRVGEGIIFALPFLIIALLIEYRARARARARAKAATASAPRPAPFAQYRDPR
jgi:hypothetical protein